MPVNNEHAFCMVCGWEFHGTEAAHAFEIHMMDHNPYTMKGWLTEYDKNLLKRMQISWGEEDEERRG